MVVLAVPANAKIVETANATIVVLGSEMIAVTAHEATGLESTTAGMAVETGLADVRSLIATSLVAVALKMIRIGTVTGSRERRVGREVVIGGGMIGIGGVVHGAEVGIGDAED